MVKTISAEMTTLINAEVLTLATCWKLTRTDGVELFITDHDADIVFAGDTYIAASGIARTAIESKADLSVDNLDIVGIFGGVFTRNDLDAGFYDFATIDIFSVNWQDPDGVGALQHRFGTIGEMATKDGSYTTEMRGMMQLLERRRGKVWAPDCRADLYSPLVNPFSGRSDGCGISAATFEEFGVVTAVTDDRKYTVGEFSRLSLVPTYLGAFGDVVGVHEVDGKVEMVLDKADATPMRPIVITDRTGLEAIADNLNGYYVLGNDIDLTDTLWTPLGLDADPFRGIFDGRGFKILQINVNPVTPVSAGLFGNCAGVIRNVGVHMGQVRSGNAVEWAGALCGLLRGEQTALHPVAGSGKIENCWSSGVIVRTNDDRAGGLVGIQTQASIIRQCWVANEINGTVGTDAGALIGQATDSNRLLADAFANTDAAGTTDLGNISGGGAFGLLDAAWILPASFTGFDFNDRHVMNVIPSGPVTVRFNSRDPINDRIHREVGSWIADDVRAGDHISFTGTANSGEMVPGTSVVIAVNNTFTRTVGSWLDDDFLKAQTITVTESSDNDGTFVIANVTALVLTVEEDITVAETAQTDLVIDWTSNNDTTYTVRTMAAQNLIVEEEVDPGPDIACNYSIAGGPRSMSPGRL